jgi:hypothetical protein
MDIDVGQRSVRSSSMISSNQYAILWVSDNVDRSCYTSL